MNRPQRPLKQKVTQLRNCSNGSAFGDAQNIIDAGEMAQFLDSDIKACCQIINSHRDKDHEISDTNGGTVTTVKFLLKILEKDEEIRRLIDDHENEIQGLIDDHENEIQGIRDENEILKNIFVIATSNVKGEILIRQLIRIRHHVQHNMGLLTYLEQRIQSIECSTDEEARKVINYPNIAFAMFYDELDDYIWIYKNLKAVHIKKVLLLLMFFFHKYDNEKFGASRFVAVSDMIKEDIKKNEADFLGIVLTFLEKESEIGSIAELALGQFKKLVEGNERDRQEEERKRKENVDLDEVPHLKSEPRNEKKGDGF